MSPSTVLSEKDANNSLKNPTGAGAGKADVKSMEYHRQVFKSKMEEEKYGNTMIPTTTTKAASALPTTTTTTTTTTGLLGTTTVAVAASAVRPSQANTSQMFIRRTIAGLPADPNASGTFSSEQKYISPSDNIMSPCTAKLNAFKGRQAGKAKPKSLFAQASAKRFVGENVLGARNAGLATSTAATKSAGGDDNDNQ